MKAWRIATARFAEFSGDGARQYGGRWNSPGRPLVYASSYLSLAMLELLVRLPANELPDDTVRFEISIPDKIDVLIVGVSDVPGWNAPDRIASRAFGDAWLVEQRTAVLLVLSGAVPTERNVLINPLHPDAQHISHGDPEPVIWDERLFRRQGAPAAP